MSRHKDQNCLSDLNQSLLMMIKVRKGFLIPSLLTSVLTCPWVLTKSSLAESKSLLLMATSWPRMKTVKARTKYFFFLTPRSSYITPDDLIIHERTLYVLKKKLL